ncbi:MAG TPA: AMP-binding protein [Bacteriovoracaceae bacterium]|nr:AMP-binding protein [Bacteriovoracaceae bacterium]
MQLRKLIQDRISAGNLNIYDRQGEHLLDTNIQREYQCIRNYILSHVKDSEVIAIKATKDYRYLLTVLACMEIGIPYIPMMVDYPEHRVEQIREDSHFKLLVTDDLLSAMVQNNSSGRELGPENPEATSYIIFTSGSTGKPKGVMIPRKALSNFMQWVGDEFTHVTSQDHMLQVTEFTFDIVLTDVGLFLQKNVHVHFSNFNSDLFRLAFEIESNAITTLSTVPNNLSMLLSDVMKDRVNLSKLHTLMIAGARFSYGLYNKCKSHLGTSIHLYNLYGPTESTVYSHGKKMTFREDEDCAGLNVTIGKTLPNVTAVVVKDGEVKKTGEEGELLLGGIQLLSKYMNDPEKTAQALIEFQGKTFYKTGDIAFCDPRGDYYVIGRLDDTLKVRGFRINLLDVDSYIHKLPYVEDCATIAIPHEIAENQTIAFLRLKSPKTVKEIKKDLLEYLLDYQIPEKMVMVESYPVNSSGKIDKKVLKENYLNSIKKTGAV